jgi:predicted alpha-1,2-mannosidase
MTLKKIFIFCLLIFYSSQLSAQEYSKLVDTKIGSKGEGLACGYNFIGATYPFGMVQFTPTFFSPQKGFVITQLNGAGCSNLGNFPILPLNGVIEKSPYDMNSFEKYEKVEIAKAGYLSLKMNDNIDVDLTVTKRSGIGKFSFDNSNYGTLIIGTGINSSPSENIKDAFVKITSDSSCEGYTRGGDFCGTESDYKIYFAAEFDRSSIYNGTWKEKKLSTKKSNSGKNSGAYFTFDTNEIDKINYRIAISFVSIENAKENLKNEEKHLTFEEYQREASKEWDKYLSTIKIKSKNEDRIKQFYTHFYHSLIHPNIVSDVNGEYMGADFKVHKTKENREQYSSFSVWDTYRTQGQLIAMLFPKKSSDMMQSLVDFAKQAGGYGRWILANIETGIMQGDPTPILISNSYAFGGDDFDLETAYRYMKKGALIPRLYSQKQEIRPYLEEYINNGHTFASMSLEYASADFAIAQFALNAVANEEDYKYFKNRSQNWKNNYNAKTKWLNSKFPNGIWKDKTHDWREGTYKNYFWMVPHNLNKLIDTIGGARFAEKRLDSLFVKLDAEYEEDWFAAGNEPDFQVPWIYNWVDKPEKTSKTIERILNEMYSSEEDGLPGNDDLGTMGAWYVFASVGLYPLIPGVGGFSINIPQFNSIDISLPNDKILKIRKNKSKNYFINSLKFVGIEQNSTWISWDKIKNGGVLDFSISENNLSNLNLIKPPSYN